MLDKNNSYTSHIVVHTNPHKYQTANLSHPDGAPSSRLSLPPHQSSHRPPSSSSHLPPDPSSHYYLNHSAAYEPLFMAYTDHASVTPKSVPDAPNTGLLRRRSEHRRSRSRREQARRAASVGPSVASKQHVSATN